VTVPLELKPPATVAESEVDPPTAIGLVVSTVEIVGLALVTEKGSQALDTAVLFPSPL